MVRPMHLEQYIGNRGIQKRQGNRHNHISFFEFCHHDLIRCPQLGVETGRKKVGSYVIDWRL